MTGVAAPAVTREPTQELQRGDVLAGRYQIEAVIGIGASGQVFRAYDRVTEAPVALKILRAEYAADPEWAARFSRELRVGRRIQHPNVCRVFDIGEADGHRFLSMELATRGPVRDDLKASAPERPLADRIADAEAVIRGVAALHAAGIIHRDIKPENILRMEDRRLVVSDFGLATNPDGPATTIMVGTPKYMAPEMVMGDPATPRSDVWALGVGVHEILFGTRPEWMGPATDRRFKLPSAADRRGIERRLARLCAECAAENPADRPRDAGDVVRKWNAAISGTLTLTSREKKRVVRTAGWAIVGAAAVTALLVTKERYWRAAAASLRPNNTSLASVLAMGGRTSDIQTRILTSFSKPIRCMSMLSNSQRIRLGIGDTGEFEDVDVSSGDRITWNPDGRLPPGTCPVWSSDGRRMLFEASSAKGARIWVADGNGKDPIEIASGSDPQWIGTNEFALNIDSAHVAVFSLPTMDFRLLQDPSPDLAKEIVRKDVDERRELVITYLLGTGERLVTSYNVTERAPYWTARVPPTTRTVGGSPATGLLLSRTNARVNDLVEVRPQSRDIIPPLVLGSLEGREIGRAIRAGRSVIFSTRKHTTHVEVFRANTSIISTEVPYAGANPAVNSTGDVLLQVSDGATQSVLLLDWSKKGRKRLTAGGIHIRPTFSGDGRSFLYTDFTSQTIRRCELKDPTSCTNVLTVSGVPAAAAESPDGGSIAYFVLEGTTRLWVKSGAEPPRDFGPAREECTPIWEGPTKVWIVQGTDRTRYWTRFDVASGTADTTRPIRSKVDVDESCAVANPGEGDPIVRLRHEEHSDLRVAAR